MADGSDYDVEERRIWLADAMRGQYWSFHACQGDAYRRWGEIRDVDRELWLKVADRALDMIQRYDAGARPPTDYMGKRTA